MLLFLVDLARNFRFTVEDDAGNVYGGGTLEWLPTGLYSTRSIPVVRSREPLWDDPKLARGRRGGPLFPPQLRHRPARDAHHQPAPRRAAIPADHARAVGLAAAWRRCSPPASSCS